MQVAQKQGSDSIGRTRTEARPRKGNIVKGPSRTTKDIPCMHLMIGLFIYFILSALLLGPTRFPPIPVTTLT